jgi:dihydrofolate synthase/folylpolyglutamate synthase
VDGDTISRHDLANLVAELEPAILDSGASYFEATTGLAFKHFARCGVDIGVIEVGMGGRLDSTNVLDPVLSCITSIDFDHVGYLGKTLYRIAGEKAGIIKPGVPVVCGRLGRRASAAVREIAAAKESPVFEVGRHASFRPIHMDLDGSTFEYAGLAGAEVVEIEAPGLHHMANAATAKLAVEVLRDGGMAISDEAVRTGLRQARWPGRLQILRRKPLVICDAAHNVSGTKLLVKSLKALGLSETVTVFAVLRDKDYHRMLTLLSGCSGRFIFTKPDSKRALPLVRLKAAAGEIGLKFKASASVPTALGLARSECGKQKTMLICGSLYALGEAMEAFDYRPYRVKVC